MVSGEVVELQDVIIIGAGIMGCCTAYHAAQRGLKPLVLEQFTAGHTKGSSHGKSRIIRYAHTNATYIPIMIESFEHWEDLEDLSGMQLINKCGVLWIADPMTTKRNSKLLNDYEVDHEVLIGSEIQRAFPQVRYNEQWYALVDREGGILHADRCLKAAQEEAVKNGAEFHFGEKVMQIKSATDGVIVVTDKTTYAAKKLVVTAGGWLNKILPDFDDIIETQAEQVPTSYWTITKNHDAYKLENCPVIVVEENDDLMYMTPPVEHHNQVKFLIHNESEPIDPDRQAKKLFFTNRLLPYHISEHFPDIDCSKPSTIDSCMYTTTDDSHCVVGCYPSDPRIIIGGGFSGNGFKFAPVIGRMLTELAQGADESAIVPELFRFERGMTTSFRAF